MGDIGRPTEYQESYARDAMKLAELGATDIEVADFFEVDVRTIYRWKHSHPDFCQSLNAGKDKADERVVNSLFNRAVGYEQDAVKIFMPAQATEPVYAPFRERIAPDTTAAIFWLKNRRSAEWRDKTQQEHTGANGGPIKYEEIPTEQLLAKLKALQSQYPELKG